MQTVITVIYYIMVACTSALLVVNFVKTKDWQREIPTRGLSSCR